jgi:putative membrane protein
MIFQILQMGPHWGGGGMGDWGMGGGSGMWGFGFLWPLLWLLIIAAIVIGAVYLFRRSGEIGGSDRAMEVLREQYARGELSDEEFDERSSRLATK